MLPVARGLPKLHIVDVWRDYLLETALSVLCPHKVLKSIVDSGSVWKHEGRTRRKHVPHEEILILSYQSVVSLCCKPLEFEILFELLFVGETNSVDSLKRVILLISLPIRSRVVGDCKRLHFASVGHVRSSAEINQWSASVSSANRAVRHLVAKNLHLVLVILEHLQRLFLWDL